MSDAWSSATGSFQTRICSSVFVHIKLSLHFNVLMHISWWWGGTTPEMDDLACLCDVRIIFEWTVWTLNLKHSSLGKKNNKTEKNSKGHELLDWIFALVFSTKWKAKHQVGGLNPRRQRWNKTPQKKIFLLKDGCEISANGMFQERKGLEQVGGRTAAFITCIKSV